MSEGVVFVTVVGIMLLAFLLGVCCGYYWGYASAEQETRTRS